jgi:hypothetical protein
MWFKACKEENELISITAVSFDIQYVFGEQSSGLAAARTCASCVPNWCKNYNDQLSVQGCLITTAWHILRSRMKKRK